MRTLTKVLAIVVPTAGLLTGLFLALDSTMHIGDFLFGTAPLPFEPRPGTDWMLFSIGALMMLSSTRFLLAFVRSRPFSNR